MRNNNNSPGMKITLVTNLFSNLSIAHHGYAGQSQIIRSEILKIVMRVSVINVHWESWQLMKSPKEKVETEMIFKDINLYRIFREREERVIRDRGKGNKKRKTWKPLCPENHRARLLTGNCYLVKPEDRSSKGLKCSIFTEYKIVLPGSLAQHCQRSSG